jgi:hypothetical protein
MRTSSKSWDLTAMPTGDWRRVRRAVLPANLARGLRFIRFRASAKRLLGVVRSRAKTEILLNPRYNKWLDRTSDIAKPL